MIFESLYMKRIWKEKPDELILELSSYLKAKGVDTRIAEIRQAIINFYDLKVPTNKSEEMIYDVLRTGAHPTPEQSLFLPLYPSPIDALRIAEHVEISQS